MTNKTEGKLPIITVYLNQRFVFDQISMLRDGLTLTKEVTHISDSSLQSKVGMEGIAGIGTAFSSLLKFETKGNASRDNSSQSREENVSSKSHTPSSIFYMLLQELKDSGLVVEGEDASCSKAGDLVEVEGNIEANPFVSMMNGVIKMLEIYPKMSPETFQGKQGNTQRKELQSLATQMKTFRDELSSGGTYDLVCSKDSEKFRTVATVEERFLNDPEMADLLDGRFKVLGKVIQSYGEGDLGVDLLRKTVLANMPSSVVGEALEGFTEMAQYTNNKEPSDTRYVCGPSIHVLPLAIYI